MKRFIQILLFVLFTISVAGLMGFIYIEQGRQPIQQVLIRIEQKGEQGFLNDSIIKDLISDYDSLLNKNANQVTPEKIELDIIENPFVNSADVFVDIDKNLIINISEKEAFLRVYNHKNNGFYIDRSGGILPLSDNYTPRVMIANGYIDVDLNESQINFSDTSYTKTPMPDLYALTLLISHSNFLKAQIGQIYVNSKGEYDLIPQLGDHLIRLGTMENVGEKLENLELFYKEALIREGWDKYEIISLKYKNQVVCKRK